MATLIQFKRGTTKNLETANPFLEKGEPCFDYEKGIVKVGDGIHRYNDLQDVTSNQQGIVYVQSKEELPAVGDQTLIYKVGNESKLYQWNSIDNKYEALGGGGIPEDEILIICGGSSK